MVATSNSRFRIRASALAVASCLAVVGWSPVAEAAGLGRFTLLSGLGQPLRAEVELVASRDELAGMSARVASADIHRQAGLDYPPTLSSVRLTIDRRPDGPAVVRVVSDRPINDPFVDMLVELNWAGGRLVREYTFLLDPPDTGGRAAVPVSAPEARGQTRTTVAEPTRLAKPAAAEPTERPRSAASTHEVQRGETLRRIAGETRHDGVSLEQMIVGIFRTNPDAFEGGNMNRLQAGKILAIPDRPTVAAIPDADAHKLFVAQAADFQGYRRRLAGLAAEAPAKPEAQGQEAGGKITAKVEEKAAPVPPRDQLKVSKTETVAGGKAVGGNGKATREEDLVAKEKALRDAQDRLATLEKNIAELQQLLAMKNQSLAEMQKQAAAGQAPAPAPAPATSPPPSAAPAQTADAVPAAPPPAAAETSPPAPKPVEAPKPAEAPKPVEPPAPPPAEPGLFDSLTENPLSLAGVGAVLVLLGGLFVYRRRQRPAVKPAAGGTEPIGAATAVFGGTGGQSVDTSTTTVPHADFSQVGPGSIDTDEVDAVAEAEVYMAYGRDSQAEEILREALLKDPRRLAIHVKLLEIYARSKNVKQFEALASELYAQTGGAGPEWHRAAALGLELDPTNPLYGGAAESVPTLAPELPATELKAAAPGEAVVAPVAAAAAGSGGLPAAAAFPALELPPEPPAAEPAKAASAAISVPHFDFDLGGTPAGAAEAQEAAAAKEAVEEAEPASLDFDLGPRKDAMAAIAAEVAAASQAPAQPAPAGVGNLIEFDLGEASSAAEAVAEPAAAPARTVDLAAIDLDLGSGAAQELAAKMAQATAPAPGPAVSEGVAEPPITEDDPRFQEVATKLELAKAYEEMGDLDGARELLREVVREGSVGQRETAGLSLARIGD